MAPVETTTLTGAKILVETLKNIGTECIFGYPGGAVLSVYDELFDTPEIKHYLMRHEQSAVHAAEGYARVSGKCGVVLVTSGPGATNTITGIANAFLDGFPILVISGQVSTNLIGKNSFQEVDFLSMTKSCAKEVFQISDISELEKTILNAHSIAMSGKKGPVVIDIPKDIFYLSSKFFNKSPVNESLNINELFNAEKVLDELLNAANPLILSGGGVLQSGASKSLKLLADKFNIPVAVTMMGIGTFPQNDENYAGMIGLYGDSFANEIFKNSDVVLALGVRFNDRITSIFENQVFATKKIIQVDINPDELSKNINAHININFDLTVFFEKMLKCAETFQSAKLCSRKQELEILKAYKSHIVKKSEKLYAYEVVETLSDFLSDKKPIVATEVGQHQICLIKNFQFNEPRKLITSGGLGSMGFGFPASIGASIASENEPVICVTGDGSFQMNMQELAVLADYNLPVKIFIFNNGYLGLVRQLQEKQCKKRYFETQISNPDFVKIAESYNILGFRVTKKDELIRAFNKAFMTKGPVVVEFITEPFENI